MSEHEVTSFMHLVTHRTSGCSHWAASDAWFRSGQRLATRFMASSQVEYFTGAQPTNLPPAHLQVPTEPQAGHQHDSTKGAQPLASRHVHSSKAAQLVAVASVPAS